MDQIQIKIKLKGCFKKFKDLTRELKMRVKENENK